MFFDRKPLISINDDANSHPLAAVISTFLVPFDLSIIVRFLFPLPPVLETRARRDVRPIERRTGRPGRSTVVSSDVGSVPAPYRKSRELTFLSPYLYSTFLGWAGDAALPAPRVRRT